MEDVNKITKKDILAVVVLMLLLLCIFILVGNQNVKKTTLTQFGPTTDRQMMGYSIKTKNNKLICVFLVRWMVEYQTELSEN